MPPKIEELIEEMEEAGVDPAFVDRIREATSASPLRAELKEVRAQAQAAIERAHKAESAALRSSFEKLGIKAKPEALAIPDTVDRLDHDAVQAWAIEAGLADPPEPNVPGAELDAMDRIAEAGVGAGAAVSATDRVLAAQSYEEFWAEAEKVPGLTA